MNDNDAIVQAVQQAREGRKLERIHLDITAPWGEGPASRAVAMIVSVQPIYDATAHTLTLADPRPISMPKGFQLSMLFGKDDNGNLGATLDLDEMGIPRWEDDK